MQCPGFFFLLFIDVLNCVCCKGCAINLTQKHHNSLNFIFQFQQFLNHFNTFCLSLLFIYNSVHQSSLSSSILLFPRHTHNILYLYTQYVHTVHFSLSCPHIFLFLALPLFTHILFLFAIIFVKSYITHPKCPRLLNLLTPILSLLS